jgi:hypothetical protein
MIEITSAHLTKFCFALSRSLSAITTPGTLSEPSVALRDTSNCTDEECNKKDQEEGAANVLIPLAPQSHETKMTNSAKKPR